MIPPQLPGSMATARRSSLTAARPMLHQASVSALLGIAAHGQTRSFWGWRRHGLQDWASQLDPLYHRFNRVRTLKTRAKLMEKLRRRGKFDWDASQRPFFSPRDVCASIACAVRVLADLPQIRFASHWNGRRWNSRQPEDAKRAARKSGEALKAAEDDISYELSRREKEWKDQMESMRKRVEQDPYEAVFGKRFEPFWSPLVPSWMREEMGLQSSPFKGQQQKPTSENREQRNKFDDLRTRLSQYAQNEQNAAAAAKEPNATLEATADGNARTYTSITSQSWDSRTNKAKRVEWDSASGMTKRFEYDPVSNRMVPAETPSSQHVPASEVGSVCSAPSPPSPLPPLSRSPDMQSLVNTPNQQTPSGTPIEIPIKTFDDEFKAASTPYDQEDAAQASTLPRRPAVLDKLPKDDIDLVTADTVRASMGKSQRNVAQTTSTSADKAAMERDFDKKVATTDYDYGDAWSKLRRRREPTVEQTQSQWDQAEQAMILERELRVLEQKRAKLLHDEHKLFHIEGQKRELTKLNHQIEQVNAQLSNADTQPESWVTRKQDSGTSSSSRLETALGRYEAAWQDKERAPVLQSCLDRMQSKELAELDDSAAHESTESTTPESSVPKGWANQFELLQEHRIKRTSPKRPYPNPAVRWIDDMNAKKAAWEASQPQPSAEEVRRTQKLLKAKEMLEAEVKEHKFKMQAHETRYAHKLRSLRQELDTAYKQSAVHSQKHVERIRFLEGELQKTQKAAGDPKSPTQLANTEAHPIKQGRGEGDFCTNITKFADSSKWYKRPSTGVAAEQLEKAEQKARDQALVREVRDIYEKAYGVIDVKHRQLPATAANRSSLDMIKERLQSQTDLAESGDLDNKARDEALARYSPAKSASVLADLPQTSQSSMTGTRAEAAADKARDEALTRYKPTFSSRSDAKHPKSITVEDALAAYKAKPLKVRESIQAVEGEGIHALDDALAQHEKSQQDAYHFKHDGLEVELAKQEREARKARALMMPEDQSKMYSAIAESIKRNLPHSPSSPKPIKDKASKVEPTSSPAESIQLTKQGKQQATTGLQWEEPPLYKVLAYDSGNDQMSTATTTSNFSGSETAISIQQALSQLYQPARFVPYFAELQKGGYQVIYGTRDLLVFKKVKAAIPASQIAIPAKTADETTGLHDHGLLGLTPKENSLAQEAANYHDKYPPESKPYDPTSIENGKMMPKENALAQEAAHAYDRAMQARLNPIDGTTRASTSATMAETPKRASRPEEPSQRVRRQEDHFTGTRRARIDRQARHQHQRKEQDGERQRSKGGAIRWALGVGAAASLTAYMVGAAAEAARKDADERKRYEGILGKHSLDERRRWQEILEGKRGRWE
ncbi:Serine-threonine rich protein [Teratosphaeria destructans]|uniref:Serine-threonine rich protein n=1 Tax=Teratosphaeria destructans TaxID=418781 RepID=A0A9W7SML2_9PEZI|nr:Serine-threonine rich protein [Teratosphaeria destructans]